MLNSEDTHVNTTFYTRKSNEDIIADTYYEYHGKHDDGHSPVERFELKGVIIA